MLDKENQLYIQVVLDLVACVFLCESCYSEHNFFC